MADGFNHDMTWEDHLKKSLGICHTCKKAYEIALFLAGITKPDLNYRKTLDIIKHKGAVSVKQIDGTQQATIVLTRIY